MILILFDVLLNLTFILLLLALIHASFESRVLALGKQFFSYFQSVRLSPLQALQFIESNSAELPQRFVSARLSALGDVTDEDLRELWDELVTVYGSSQSIAQELFKKLEDFLAIN